MNGNILVYSSFIFDQFIIISFMFNFGINSKKIYNLLRMIVVGNNNVMCV